MRRSDRLSTRRELGGRSRRFRSGVHILIRFISLQAFGVRPDLAHPARLRSGGRIAGIPSTVAIVHPVARDFADECLPKPSRRLGQQTAPPALFGIQRRSADIPRTPPYLGRALLQPAESLGVTGGVSLGPAAGDDRQRRKPVARVGTATFAMLSLGAPIGIVLYAGRRLRRDCARHNRPTARIFADNLRVPADPNASLGCIAGHI